MQAKPLLIVFALVVCLILGTASVAQAQTGGGMKLDQRNMNLYTDDKPLMDFANLGSGTISMIDGHHQAAYFDERGRLVSGTGRFEYRAKVPKGIYMGFTFQMDGHETFGGIHVSDMIVEYRFDGQGPKALQYAFIDKLKLADNQFEWAFKGNSGSMETGATIVKESSVVEGRLRLQLIDLRGSQKNQWFAVHLNEPLHGTLVKCGSPPRTLTATNTGSDTENGYPLGKTAAALTNDAVVAATGAARKAVLADLQKQAAAISCAGQCFIGNCAKVVSTPTTVVISAPVATAEHLFGLNVRYTANAKVTGSMVVECQCQ